MSSNREIQNPLMLSDREIRHYKDGSVAEVVKDPSGFYRYRNLTPGKGKCVFCGGPLDADADMVGRICTKCWEETFK